MDKVLEEVIVRAFFAKEIRDRVMFELSSPKKRKDALSRLCHTYSSTLNAKYIIEIPKPNSNAAETAKLLKSKGAGEMCYSISFDEEIDGKYMPLIDALECAVGMGMPSLISCVPGELAYFEAEQEQGAPQRFILQRKSKV